MIESIDPPETEQTKWLRSLGAKFVDVWLCLPNGDLVDERHVDDPETLETTVQMSMDRLDARTDMFPCDDRWCVFSPYRAEAKRYRYYPTREAAEMVMIHRV